ncbi:MAG: hypothetical protein M3400_17515 [Actinomycetota bacterium]|nr:hypothetical protein [Actinomycetota bacterium]
MVVVNNSSSPSIAEPGVAGVEATEVTSEPTTAASGPAFSGTYAVTLTVTTATGITADDFPVGQVGNLVYQVTPSCSSGPCDVTVVNDTGVSFDMIYANGTWTSPPLPISKDCFDENGAPTGVVVTTFVTESLDAIVGGSDPSSATPLSSLGGTGSLTTQSDCDGNPATYEYYLELTRTGD